MASLSYKLRMILNRLGEFLPGDQLEIIGFDLDSNAAENLEHFLHRLSEVGFIIGELIEVIGHAPYSKDPISVRVKDATYALRRADANFIYVKRQNNRE
jgi:Fe2+ transport system protein FeoA